MSGKYRKNIEQVVSNLLADQQDAPPIGASLVPMLLAAQGQSVVPSLQGGQIMPTHDRLGRSGLDQVFFKSEAGLGFALLGMAKSSRKATVGIVTSGPGGLNTITPLADATRDCAPVGMLCGQVPQSAMGTDAFQGVDIVDVVRPITKSARFVDSLDNLIDCIPRDLGLAASGKPGSVLWDLPKNVQITAVDDLAALGQRLECYEDFIEKPELDTASLDRAIELLYQSDTPAILAGYGLVLADVYDEFQELLRLTNLPVIYTLPGKASVSSAYKYNMGMLGMNGLYSGSACGYYSDFLLSLGSRYDDRAVGNPDTFAPLAKKRNALVHVDTEPEQFGLAKELLAHKLCVQADAGDVVRYLLEHIDPKRIKIEPWLKKLEAIKKDNLPPRSIYDQNENLNVIH
ncbi:MAG: thiamine pyrophosphate-binding protein, partial [Candidatus Marinimicrobia bacterium]|nr:thiamine pyrophosphate-binding protein [Candidatus Neomarinimicrobiota bacterium]